MGSPWGYFAKSYSVKFKNQSDVDGQWKIRLTNIGADQILGAVNTDAVFDTTTEFIWVALD